MAPDSASAPQQVAWTRYRRAAAVPERCPTGGRVGPRRATLVRAAGNGGSRVVIGSDRRRRAEVEVDLGLW